MASSITISNAVYTAGGTGGTGAGTGPSLDVTGTHSGGTANFTLYGATHVNGTTVSKAELKAGTGGDIEDAFNVSAATIDGLDVSPTLTTSLTNGHLSIYIEDSAGTPIESEVTKVNSVNVDATSATLSIPVATQTGQTTASWSVTSNESTGIVYAGIRPTASAVITNTQLIAGSGGAGVGFDNDATMTADGSCRRFRQAMAYPRLPAFCRSSARQNLGRHARLVPTSWRREYLPQTFPIFPRWRW